MYHILEVYERQLKKKSFNLSGPEWVKLEPCMADDSVQVSNADSDPLQCCVQTLAPKRRMEILCLEAERTDDTRFNLWLGPSVPSFHFHLWMNKVLCLSGCFGPSESGNPLSESPHSYPMRWPLSVGPFTHLGRPKPKRAMQPQFVLAMKLSPRRGAKGAIGATSPHGLQK